MSSIDGLSSRSEKRRLATDVVRKKQNGVAKPKQPKPRRQMDISGPKKPLPQQKREDFLEPVKSFDFDLSSEDLEKKPVTKKSEELKIGDEILAIDNKKKKKSKKEKPKNKKKKRIIILSCVLGVLAILVAVILIWGNDLISKLTGGNSGIWDLSGLISEEYVDLKTDSKGRTNILVFGTSGYDMSGSEGDGTHDGAQLTDSIMIVSLDQFTGDIAMASLPRDLKAGATCTGTGKVNEVYWCANQSGTNEEAGARALMDKVTEIFGVDFQYYVHVDWAALTTVVDSIGGITVTLDEDINDYYYTKTVIAAGVPTTLNGEQALGLARARHGTTLGDFSRGNSQQKILIAIKDKILSEGIDITRALDLVNALGDNVRTNFSLEEVKTGVHFLSQFDLSSMRQVPILDWGNGIKYMTTANIGGISYVIPTAGVNNYAELQAYIAKMFDSDPAVREDATIEVLNGTEESGVASGEREKLKEAGIEVKTIGDAPAGEYSGTTIYAMNEDKPGTKARLEKHYGVQAKSVAELPAGVVSDCDFVIIVGNQ